MSSNANIQNFTDALTVIINEGTADSVSFIVHETRIVAKSNFLEAACRNGCKEATSRVVILPDIDFDTFETYLEWIYSGKVLLHGGPYLKAGKEHTGTECINRSGIIHTNLAKLWILADRLADLQLRNAVIDVLASGISKRIGTRHNDKMMVFPPELTTLIRSGTTDSRPLRKLALDCYVGRVWGLSVNARREEFATEFFVDLAVAAMVKLDEDDIGHKQAPLNVKKHGPCYYHEHDEHFPPC